MLEFVILALATWRLASLIVNEDGPFDLFGRLRSFLGVRYNENNNPYGTKFWSELVSCVWCTSVWIAFPIALIVKHVNIPMYIAYALALSAVAIMVQSIVDGKE